MIYTAITTSDTTTITAMPIIGHFTPTETIIATTVVGQMSRSPSRGETQPPQHQLD